ncbi:MAG: primosomal protein N' [Bacteroidota bacterium]
MIEAFATFVDVVLPLYVPKLYTYRVADDLVTQTQTGKRVSVQFGKSKVYAAIVAKVHNTPPKDYEAKYILSVLDEEPIIFEQQLKFWQWISDYYLCNMGDVMQAALPAMLKLQSASKIIANPDFDTNTVLDDREYMIMEALQVQHELTIDNIQQIINSKNALPIIKSLVIKEAIIINEQIHERYKEKLVSCIKLTDTYTHEENLKLLFDLLAKKEKQIEALVTYVHLKQNKTHVLKADLIKKGNVSTSSLQTLIKNGVFEEFEIAVDRLQFDENKTETFELNAEQAEAFIQIEKEFIEKDVVLLQGVTSSGKTHVYVRLMEQALKQGKQILYLLPEIAITSQIIHRIKKYFGEKCVAFHNKIGDNERVEIWNKVKSSDIKIVIGARSAIFLPFANLGLTIVDEEHETTFKQNDPAPRYHARDSAVVLNKIYNSKLILGSATPSFESYFNAKGGRYGLVKLTKRHGEIELPQIITANIAEERKAKIIQGNLTTVLVNEIKETLAKSEQVILFQNRRGYSPVYECDNCQWVPKCQNCDISLTYHKYIDSLKCHYCGFTQKLPDTCMACGAHTLSFKGFGTEKIEDELAILFPTARVARFDQDSVKGKNGHEHIIKDFAEHRFDIMVGTQMVTKGLDFDNVTLVGVINADQLLYFPDFRANERAFQLIEQVSGRGGRRKKQGRVVIQTSSPNHPVVTAVINHDYEAVYNKEIQDRAQFLFPPFQRIIKISLRHKEFKVCENAAEQLHHLMHGTFGDNLLGPANPYVSRIRNYYIKEFLVKIDRTDTRLPALKKFIRQQIAKLYETKLYSQLIIQLDVDAL